MNPDDPRLTAYALGELDADGRAEIEELLREEPVIAAEVVATRQFAKILRVRLKSERAESLHSGQRAEVLACAARAMPRRTHSFPRQITGWLALAAGVVLGIGIALLFPALNSLKVPPTSAGVRQSSPQDGSDVRVALAADPAPPDGDAVVVNDWPLEGAMPVFPNPHGAMWAVGRMTSHDGDSVWHFDTKLPAIEFSPPPVAQNAAPISASNHFPAGGEREDLARGSLRDGTVSVGCGRVGYARGERRESGAGEGTAGAQQTFPLRAASRSGGLVD